MTAFLHNTKTTSTLMLYSNKKIHAKKKKSQQSFNKGRIHFDPSLRENSIPRESE